MLEDGLSGPARELYGKITRGEQTDGSDSTLAEELARWHLVTTDPDRPGNLVALEPREAGRRRLLEQARDIAVRASMLAEVPGAVDELARHYERARTRPGDACEYLDDPGVVNARIGDALGNARVELLTAQPGGPRTRELLQIALARDTAALERGVQVRTLYRDAVREDPVTRDWATTMTGMGVQFRTLVGPFERCVVVDREQAFISDYAEGSPQHAAWHIRDRAFVGFITQVFEETWRRAQVWHGDARPAGYGIGMGAGPRTTRMQREILRDTCAGVGQRKTAARLGISERRVTRQLEALRNLFSAPTTTALAYQWALSPERLIDDDPDAVRQYRPERPERRERGRVRGRVPRRAGGRERVA